LARLDSARYHAHVVRPANKLTRLHAPSALANDLRAASSGNAPLGTFAFFHFAKPQIRISDPTGTQANLSSTSYTNSTDLPPITIYLSCMPLFASYHCGSVHTMSLPPDVCHVCHANILVRSEKESQESKKNKES
jgi:hypothetical protein